MAVTYISSGTAVYSTGNPSPTTPAHNVGDMLILVVGTKPDTTPATLPTGWTQLGVATGGVGTNGAATGPMRVGLFYRIADGTATDTTGAITITGNNISAAQVHVFRPASTLSTIDIVGVGAADTTTGTPFSAVMPSNPDLTVGDALLSVGVVPTNVAAGAAFSAETVAATGMTTVSMTEIGEFTSAIKSGATTWQIGGYTARGTVVTGTSTAAPTVSATAGGTTTNIAGPIYLVRLREISLTTVTASDTAAISVSDTSSVFSDTAFISASDTCAISVADASSVVSSASITASDSAAISISDVSASTSTLSRADAAAVSVAESSSISSTVSTSDTSAISVGDYVSGYLPWYQHISDNFETNDFSKWDAVATSGSQTVATSTSAAKNGTYGVRFTTTTGVEYANLKKAVGPNSVFLSFAGWVRISSATGSYELFSIYNNTNLYAKVVVNDGVVQIAAPLDTLNMGSLSANTWAYLEFQLNDDGSYNTYTNGVDTGYSDVIALDQTSFNTFYLGESVAATSGSAGTVDFDDVRVMTDAPAIVATPITGTDAASISVSDVSSMAQTFAKSATDTAAISISETSSIQGTLTSTDTTAISVADASTNQSTLSRTDSAAVSASDVASIQVTQTTSDTAAISVSDASSVVVSHARADAAAVSVAETSTVAVTQPTTDTSAISVTESRTLSGSSTSSDTCAISVSDVASISVTQSASDTSAISVSETSSSAGTMTRTDAASISVSDIASAGVSAPGQESPAISVAESVALAASSTSADAAAVSVTESSTVTILQFVTASDTSAISITETTVTQKPIVASDSAAVSVVESRLIDSATSVTDAANISVVDNTTQALSFTSDDAIDLSIDDVSEDQFIDLTDTDESTVSIVDDAEQTLAYNTDDTVAITIDDVASIVIIEHAVTMYVYTSGQWVEGKAYIYENSQWKELQPVVYTNAGWS